MTSSEYVPCSQCGEEITQDSDFCPHCGVIFFRTDGVKCDTHPLVAAVGICIICRKLVCDECGKFVRSRCFCLDHRRVEVQQDWALIFQSTDINDSELAKSFLESNGFKVLVQNFMAMGYAWDGGGDSPLSRSNLNKPAKVFVPIPEYVKAEEALREWKSAGREPQESDTDKSL